MSISLDKRIPFGFKGVWGKCYKHTIYSEISDKISYEQSSYFDVGFDIQFKYLEDGVDKHVSFIESVSNLISKGSYRVVKTTDATFFSGRYESVVQLGDIVFFDGKYWLVDNLEEKSIYNPNKQTFYYIGMKDIFKDVFVGG